MHRSPRKSPMYLFPLFIQLAVFNFTKRVISETLRC